MGPGSILAKSRLLHLLASLAIVLVSLNASVSRASSGTVYHSLAPGTQGGRYYAATGKTLASEFVSFYDLYGGVPQFGYPLTEARMENGYLVQWTERQRLEYHPEHAGTEYEVLLGLLGRDLTTGLEGTRFRPEMSKGGAVSPNSEKALNTEPLAFPETGHTVAEPFLSYWQEQGGLRVFGYPVSGAYTENGLTIQWFERARFEYHPEYAEHPVLLGLLGVEGLKRKAELSYTAKVSASSVPDEKFEVDLAQGGESEDPTFLANVRDSGRQLGPGLVRLDNIYNFYGIVQRDESGAIHYDWTRFDIALKSVWDMGKEPMICLSYMPETMSATGVTRVAPPKSYDEWSELVRATVAHVNGTGGPRPPATRVRYWEVWNEPDQWGFWQASYADYLHLYDVTVEAVKSVDPQARVGGPGVSHFSPDHLRVFMMHEALEAGVVAPTSRIDFLSWHEYGRTPEGLSDDIRDARSLIADFPQFSPELFVTEFNVLQGGPGDTSIGGYTDRVQGAIGVLRGIEVMERERLDRGFLFELKDGHGPSEYWGRWGILTNSGYRKPVYYALKEWATRPAGRLPVNVIRGATDGTLGVMAFGGAGGETTIFLWYTGTQSQSHVKVGLPDAMLSHTYDMYLFDEAHNNPASNKGVTAPEDDLLQKWDTREGGDLDFDLQPESLVIIKLAH